MSDTPCNTSRRTFLTGAAACAVMTLAPGVLLYAGQPDGPGAKAVRWGMLVDATRCNTGCDACVRACSTEFGLSGHGRPETDVQWIRKVQTMDKGTGRTASFPVMCQHCAKAPCVDVCPTGASFTRVDGVVLVNRHICIGCRYCMMSCPYKARNFVHEDVADPKSYAPRGKGTVEACTLCVHRVDAGRPPACVEACAAAGRGALIFGNLNNPGSDIAKRVAAAVTTRIRPDLLTDPGIRYQGL